MWPKIVMTPLMLAFVGCAHLSVGASEPAVVMTAGEPQLVSTAVTIRKLDDETYELASAANDRTDEELKLALNAKSSEVCRGAYQHVREPQGYITLCVHCGGNSVGAKWIYTIHCENAA